MSLSQEVDQINIPKHDSSVQIPTTMRHVCLNLSRKNFCIWNTFIKCRINFSASPLKDIINLWTFLIRSLSIRNAENSPIKFSKHWLFAGFPLLMVTNFVGLCLFSMLAAWWRFNILFALYFSILLAWKQLFEWISFGNCSCELGQTRFLNHSAQQVYHYI